MRRKSRNNKPGIGIVCERQALQGKIWKIEHIVGTARFPGLVIDHVIFVKSQGDEG
jgi:hypothetical protein